MPKTNDGGATAAGSTGIVQHGAPLPDGRVLSELDPERNLDGTLIDGEHPDHAVGEEREAIGTTEVVPIEDETPDSAPEREEESSPGYNSPASSKKIASTNARNVKTSR